MADPAKLQAVVVAIPTQDDRVWKVSSEKVPHMTLCYLGEPDWNGEQLQNVVEYIGHAASTLNRFGMAVDRRGTLGADDADVLFFEKEWSFSRLENFRSNLLKNQNIHMAYLAADQYPSWTPHLTLGYPKTPAKPDDRDYPINWVNFDRISLWLGDSEGPTFQLKRQDEQDVAAMAQTFFDLDEEVLEHYGVKGMKWGQHRRSAVPAGETHTVQRKPGKRVKAVGGREVPAHEDAIKTALARQTAKKSTTDALSTKELQALVNRMNLEKQFRQLNPNKVSKGASFIKTLIGVGKTANEVVAFNNSPAGKALREQLG